MHDIARSHSSRGVTPRSLLRRQRRGMPSTRCGATPGRPWGGVTGPGAAPSSTRNSSVPPQRGQLPSSRRPSASDALFQDRPQSWQITAGGRTAIAVILVFLGAGGKRVIVPPIVHGGSGGRPSVPKTSRLDPDLLGRGAGRRTLPSEVL